MKLHLPTCPELNREARAVHLYDVPKTEGYPDEDQAKMFGLIYLRVFKSLLDWIF